VRQRTAPGECVDIGVVAHTGVRRTEHDGGRDLLCQDGLEW
jgi:hypothetical protein